MVVILPEDAYGDWLTVPAEATRDFLTSSCPSGQLIASAMPSLDS